MIGVIADPPEHSAVREFFELFKTPWEFYLSDRQYDVLLCAGDRCFARTAKLVVCYGGRKSGFDEGHTIQPGRHRGRPNVLSYRENRIPIYGDTVTFSETDGVLLREESSQECAAYLDASTETVLARIGYDLFKEVGTLLTAGQPVAMAKLPALELHIAFLRDLIVACGVSLIEIPPVPEGYQFLVCLTHDIDHPLIRRHQWDHTVLGFLYRAVFGSLRNVIRGRMPIQDLLANWVAVLKLPLVYLGLAKDFWSEFGNGYLKLEKDLSPTFFAIPFKNRAGETEQGAAPPLRAARYGAHDIAGTLRKLLAADCEIGLHGIDAWLDSARGHQELEEIRRLTGASEIGVRMHWLYYNQQSPGLLEKARAAYDSTVGYNETVGYRAGTTQVYKPLETTRLLELPMHVMDTALFYPSYLNLSPSQAKKLLNNMIDNVVNLGGTLTINWHDRSIASERLWGAFYADLLQHLKSRGAWFATAQQATSWFRKRRSATFETEPVNSGTVRVKAGGNPSDRLPGLRLRVHKARESATISVERSADYLDMGINRSVDTVVSPR